MATKWLEERWASLIPALEPLGNDECEEIRAICEAEKEWWRKRPGIRALGSLGKPMTDTRNHIREVLEVRDDNSWINPKTGVPEHIALKYMNFSTEEWTQMSLPADAELQARLVEVMELRDPRALVALGERLLRMSAWPELVLGIGLNTGRSLAEILKTGIWRAKTAYSVLFSGPMTVYEKMCPFFEIPTFSRAEVVLEAISRVREMFGMQFAYVTRRDVGRQCGPMVRQVAYQYFGDLVPTRRDGDLYQALLDAIAVPGERERAVTERARLLAELSEEERKSAYERYEMLRPCLEDGVSQAEIARREQISLKNIQRWIKQYREAGLVGLARRRRSDRGKRRGIPLECVHLIEGLALQCPRRSAAAIHRHVEVIAKSQGWPALSYGRVYAIIAEIDPELVVLAHEGSRVYQEKYDVLFLHEVSRPNERWQADHCWLNIWLVNEKGQPARPVLTVILDEYSRAVMGYRLSFEAPSAYQTGLALRQAIWRKEDARWPACGIPEAFYSDHGSDFTSKKIEQVAAHLSVTLIFSQPGRPRGRGKIERFFRSVREMVLPGLPGYIPRARRSYRSARKRQRQKTAMAGKADRQASLTLAEFDVLFRKWVLDTYHRRRPRRLKGQPMELWQQGRWLPRLPPSLAH